MSGKERGLIVGADINEFENFTTEAAGHSEMLWPSTQLFDRIESLRCPSSRRCTASASAAAWN